MVGDELHSHDANAIVGIDIVSEAKQAAERDRDGVYNSYFVADLTDLPEECRREATSAETELLNLRRCSRVW